MPFPLKSRPCTDARGTYRVTLDARGEQDHNTAYPWFVIAEEVEITHEEAEITFGANKEVVPDDGTFVLMQGVYFLTIEKTGEDMAGHWDIHVTREIQGYGDPYIPWIWAPVATELWGASPEERWLDDKDSGSNEIWTGYVMPFRVTAYKGAWTL